MSDCTCGARWSGFRPEHCTVCHRTFSGTEAGDLHRTGNPAVSDGPRRRRCRTEAEMLKKGMEAHPNVHGTPIWSRGSANRKDGKPQAPKFFVGAQLTDGPAGVPEGDCPTVGVEALESEVSA